jgi:ABC-type taurine transport system substrate-binding protein
MTMTNPNDPAHPQHGWSSDPKTVERMSKLAGLTKREYFAAMAMNGLLASQFKYEELADYATKARVAADALIAELNKANP